MEYEWLSNTIDFVALDIETTGLDKLYDEIIEIGAIRFSQNKQVDKLSFFIKPTIDVPTFIKQLTHITDAELDSGISLHEGLVKLIEFIGDSPILCHNTSFDIEFVNQKLIEESLYSFKNEIYDTLDLSRIYLPYLKNHKLNTVGDFFGLKNESAHRAIFDAEITGKIFLKLLDFIQQNTTLPINNHLLHISDRAKFYSDTTALLQKIVNHIRRNALLKPNNSSFKSSFFNVIKNDHKTSNDVTIDQCFQANGFFASAIPNYEIREGQIQMSKAIYKSLLNEQILLSEAGTGVGKSLAYLIPALKFSKQHSLRIVVSTNTKNLQEQLFFKDIPSIKQNIPIPFLAVILKGRENYLCKRKWNDLLMQYEEALTEYEIKDYLNLFVWESTTTTGDISENSSFSRKSPVWRKVCADRHFCTGRKCQYYSKCYLMSIRKTAEKANLIIVNHSLLLSDLAGGNSTLGEYDHLIIDEAHNLPDQASSFLGLSISYSEVNNFLNMLYNEKSKFQGGILPKIKSNLVSSLASEKSKKQINSQIEKLIETIPTNRDIFIELFSEVSKMVQEKGQYNKYRIKSLEEFPHLSNSRNTILKFWENLSTSLERMRLSISDINGQKFKDYDTILINLDGAIQRIEEFHNVFAHLKNKINNDNVFWLSSFSNNKKVVSGVINYAPLDIDKILPDMLYKQKKSIIFTSATLAIRGVFKYFMNRMGLNSLPQNEVETLIVPSPFDYDRQTSIVLSDFLPSPKDRFFKIQAFQILKDILLNIRVGTMVLFTSYSDLNKFYEEIQEVFYQKDIRLLAQGKGSSRSVILNEFRENGKAVLLGTSSFWEGVDVQGSSLELLIMFKLPFQVPSDPIVEAYQEKLEAENKHSFMNYMLPNALLKYRQGFGRLIRSKKDKGVFWILDNRISNKQYGKYFMQILPTKTQLSSNINNNFELIRKKFQN